RSPSCQADWGEPHTKTMRAASVSQAGSSPAAPHRRARPGLQRYSRNNSETFVPDTGVVRHPDHRLSGSNASIAMQSASRPSIGWLGPRGDHCRRLLFHHLPLAIISVVLVVLFTAAPVFDVTAYGHPDIVTHAVPQAQADSTPTSAHGHGSERHDGAAGARLCHVTEHNTATMGHGGQGRHAVHSAEP